MNTREITSILAEQGIQVNRKLGQNFLCNEDVVDRILSAAGAAGDDRVLEIGPGLGALTERFVEQSGSVTAVEIDAGIARYLQEKFRGNGNCTVVHGDFLKLRCEGNFTMAVSNLPYYCASEMLFRLAVEYGVPEMYVMVQHEMAERLAAGPGTKQYGALTVSLSMYYRCRYLFGIDKRSFYPKPEVRSAFLEFTRRDDITPDMGERELFHLVVKSAFWGRRKTLLKSLSDAPHLDFTRDEIRDVLNELDIDGTLRGENLGVEDYKRIAASMNRRTRQ